MTITDADRHRLYDALVATLGEQEATILMELNHPGSDGGSFYWFPTPTGSACWAA